jgi:NB-ARC domain
LALAKAQDQKLAVEDVKRWLSSHQNWLLILDNVSDLAMAHEFLPIGKNGHVLLTTRAFAIGAIARRIDLQKMGTEEGALLVLRRAKYIPADAQLAEGAESDRTMAKEIAMQLDGLPLALDQTGAYLEETGCGLFGYLKLYRHHAPALLKSRGELAYDHPDPVASTWALSFDSIGHQW